MGDAVLLDPFVLSWAKFRTIGIEKISLDRRISVCLLDMHCHRMNSSTFFPKRISLLYLYSWVWRVRIFSFFLADFERREVLEEAIEMGVGAFDGSVDVGAFDKESRLIVLIEIGGV